TTVYFLTPFNDKTVSIWGWYADGQAADGFTDWSQRPAMTADGTETYDGATHYKYKYTFTGKEPAYLNIDEGGLEVIKGAACESSKKYVYEKTTRTVKIVNDQPWGNVYAYTWDWDGQTGGADAGKKFGAWPGAKLNGYDSSIGSLAVAESVQDNVTTYTMTVSDYLRNWSDKLIISNGDDKQKTVSLADGGEYHTVPDQTFTVYFKKPDGWTKVYAYTYGPETEGAFPGTEAALVDATEQIYSWSYSGWLPQAVIFSGGTGGAEGTYQRTVNVRGSENNGKTFQLDGTEVPVSGSGDSSELAPKSEDAGHDVIYQMNIGSFTATGTFSAATSELANLRAKGIDIIWVMPIFKRDGGLNSPYAATAYDQFQYGTAAEFSSFVSTAHTLGMKVWLDWAANHNSTQHTWHTTHTEYYAKSNGNYINPEGGGITYSDVHQLDLRDENPAAQNAMIAEMKKFVDGTYATSGAAIDGFRCDMVTGYGNYLPKSFWSKAISELREVKPELKFLAETDIHNHTQDSLATCGFDFDYAWNFHDELANAGANATAVKAAADKAATEGFRHMFYLTNHDVNYGKSMTEEFGQRAYPLTVMEFTLPGMPLLYNGQENGYLLNNKLNYFTDSDVDWTYHNYKMENTVKALVNLKRSNPALADGNAGGIYMPLNSYSNYEAKTKSDQIVSYARRLGKKWVLVVLNVSDQQASAVVDDVITGNWSCIIDSRNIAFGGTTPTTQEVAEDLSLALTLEPNGYRVYTLDAEETGYEAGYYLRYNGHWNRTDTTKPLRKVENGSAVQDGIYTLVIDAEDFDDYRAADDKVDGTDGIYFKLKEFYEYLGSVITNPNDILRPLKESSPNVWDTPDPEFTPESGDKSPLWEACTNDNQKAFYFKKTEGVKRYIISLKRIREPQYDEQGQWIEDKFNTTVNVNFVYDLEKTFKLHHYESTTQGGYEVKNDDMLKAGDEGFEELIGSDQDYHYAIRIKAEDFDKYSNKDFYDRVFFAFYEPQTGGEDHDNYVAPTTTGNGRLISEESNIDNAAQYISGIDIETDIAKFRKDAYYIIKQADVKEYIIKLRKNEGDDNYTVKVEFRKTSAFPGHSVDEVLGEKVYLYNVGAQKFIIPTGAWGTEAGLLYNDLGMAMKISKNGARYTLQTIVATDWGAQLGVDEGQEEIRIYVDRNTGSQWAFEEVPGMDNTYRLALYNQKKGGDLYIYAGNTVISNDGNDGLSQDVPITERNDEVCFTREPSDEAALQKYYYWKIVTYQELLELWKGRGNSNEVYGGADVDGTFMLNDYEFARGNTEQWTQQPNGMFKKNALGDRKLTGKLFHARIMNNGTMSQTARCYAGGVYRFRCNGFTNMNQYGHVYMYAEVPGQTVRKQDLARATKDYQTDGYQAKALEKGDFDDDLYNLYKNQGRTSDDIHAGVDFFNNEYVNDYYFYVPQSLIDASTTLDEAGDKYVEITIGFEITGGTNVNSDYTAIDKVRLHYLGKSPFVLSDTKTEESQYTYTDGEDDAQFPIYLQREFWDKQWNPLLLPVTLSAAQVRSAFGERTQVAAANG
ncbi:MAG: starch-binding protein, partial [Prevotella sp.]|nr:starch-binding protein [Prevotella sp.]